MAAVGGGGPPEGEPSHLNPHRDKEKERALDRELKRLEKLRNRKMQRMRIEHQAAVDNTQRAGRAEIRRDQGRRSAEEERKHRLASTESTESTKNRGRFTASGKHRMTGPMRQSDAAAHDREADLSYRDSRYHIRKTQAHVAQRSALEKQLEELDHRIQKIMEEQDKKLR